MEQQSYHVLYVDDEASNLRIFRAAFRRYYTVYTAQSGEQALQLLKEQPVDIVVTDQRMPGMTGVAFLEKVIALYPDVVRIILTGFSDVEDIIYALNRCGVYRYLVKPWDREEMKHTLDKALESVQLRKDKEALLSRLQKVNSELEKRVEERTKELRVAKEKAEKASKAKETFLSTMSHEIRTPLNAIVGTTNLLKKSKLSAEQLENIEILGFSSQHLLSLINDILDLSKIESGKINIETNDFPPKEMIAGIVKSFSTTAQEKGLKLKVVYDKSLPDYLIGDAMKIGQILTNLLSNAIKFTEEGKIEVHIGSIKREDNTVQLSISVKDTGIGIPKDKLDYIFKDFTQASADTTRKFGGTGLGLSICSRLTELMDGTLTVESKEGKGAKFTFAVALKIGNRKKQRTPIELEEKNQPQLEGVKVLVAEDNLLNQKVITKFLGLWKAEIFLVKNGAEAVQEVQNQKFDLVLMDLQMPEMDGYEATRQIRKLPKPIFQTLPILALTASALISEQDKVKEAGMNDFITKPFHPEDLLAKIQHHIKVSQELER